MDAAHWLVEIRAELARRKLPPFYVERLVEELSDHFHDAQEDRMSTDAQDLHGLIHQFGSPAAVAASAVSEFRKQRFSRRHPVWTFVVMPVLMLFVLWVGSLFLFTLAAGGVSWMMGGRGERFPEWLVAVMPIIATIIVLVPIALSAIWFCRVARRASITWKWPLGACLLLALIGGTAFFDLKLASGNGVLHDTKFYDAETGDPAKGHLMFGFGINRHLQPWQMLQFSIPLAVCGLFLWRQVRERRENVLAS